MAKRDLVMDEWGDRYFARPLARVVVAIAAPTPITPNGLTLVSGSCGIVSGVCLALGYPVAAAIALAMFLIFDCSDGQLARLRGGGGVYGRAFDGVGDYATALAVHVGLGFYLSRRMPIWAALLWTAGAGVGIWLGALLVDRYKRRYDQKRDDIAEVHAEIAGSTGFKRWLLKRFLVYAEQLERDDVEIPDPAAYRAKTRGPMQWFLWNGPTTHYVVFALTMAFCDVRYYCYLATGGIFLSMLTLKWQRRIEVGVVAPSGIESQP